MRQGRREGQGVPLVELIAFALTDPDRDGASDDVQELLTGMVVAPLAAGARREAKELRLQGYGGLGELLDPDHVVGKLDDGPPPGAHHAPRPPMVREQLGERGAVSAGELLEAGDAGPARPPLD